MRKRTTLAIAFLIAETLVSCGSDQNPNDGINEEDARESESRERYGDDETWQNGNENNSNYQEEAGRDKHQPTPADTVTSTKR